MAEEPKMDTTSTTIRLTWLQAQSVERKSRRDRESCAHRLVATVDPPWGGWGQICLDCGMKIRSE